MCEEPKSSRHTPDGDGAPRQPGGRRRGWFISLEGGEGSGKSTQAAVVMDWLRSRGMPCRLVREPGGTPLGERLRELLLNGTGRPVPVAEMLLFAAARAQLVETVILPSLLAGETVVCDRYVDSSLAYQGSGLGLGWEAVWSANRWATRGIMPDLTLLFDCPPELARARHRRPGDDIERRGQGFHRRVREGYRALARAHGNRVVVIDASRPALEVAAEVRRVLERWFVSTGAPVAPGPR
ncbi:thymidylate kinase [Thermaerobacter marianensis DSM 12885]|uniref:Thymidylate kinase n=1 Tax=Thermaerobacter marianensis (strain ATCC 700841 / DSM 12885 / JCM 10246 / 7p75a) TaxID=644966 RepID=E6SL01_THEM7|nr:dTMP kinase [Thermaerobacter marianensis]ADU50203.1 thymidylate kinase [Thermaerobacter marianensis DSM 12885]